MRGLDPRRTHAVVVGIERYRAGPTWNLVGPADDAREFVDWLLERGVPPGQILLHLSPIESSRVEQWAGKAGVRPEPATKEKVTITLTETLKALTGELLIVHWGGHGVLTLRGSRRLYFADATEENRLNLDFGLLLEFLRSEFFLPGFPQQLAFIDACQNYLDEAQLSASLPHEKFPEAAPVLDRGQFSLFAARPGELAKNSGERRSGWFSHEVLQELRRQSRERGSDWPPDTEALLVNVRNAFADLRANGKAAQTPAALIYRTAFGEEEGSLWQRRGHPNDTAPRSMANPFLAVPVDDRFELAWKLQATPFGEPSTRALMLRHMRPEVRGLHGNQSANVYDILEILETCGYYPGGLDELMHVVRAFCPDDSIVVQDLLHSVRRILPSLRLAAG